MTVDGEYEPSPWAPIAEQVTQYEATDGQEGGTLQDKPCIILWSLGRRSGKVRKTPLMRVADGERYAVVASMGGAPQHPVWYHNLVANPDDVALQDGATLRDYTAHEANGDEKVEWWARATEVWPDYDNYQAATDRTIPLVVLEPKG
jgi:deazaflavin-dependent oxidoreductase (nitroreductase family)